ncbi:carbohydrate ABC transporter permease [Paradevosia shaoguanensis]|uniref:Sugar ABC transporter permease n=1 Tax=Paradevosia shaoguanensis TaxID=1335043 RepID=A0AA41QQG6_9HYPH|nr:sugar ABC transporter permease [Paradevosia shaoguanensis]MCF1744327.1 sugar ABC transporter permease [Paradevosia shaoguanensis]MCI0128810.1 sugar ABC transporter permease [Paradevosia shaoguanensis]
MQQNALSGASLGRKIWADRWIYVFLLPTLTLVGAFTIYPVIASIWFSLLDWNGFERAGAFIGLGNYHELVGDPLFWNAFRNTIVFLLLAVPLRVGIALALAVVLNAHFPLVRVFRTAIFLPVVTTAAIVGVVMRYVLDPTGGPLNIALLNSHILGQPLNFLGNAGLALYSAVGIWVWKWLGITLIYWLAALQTIPRDLYEAAELDGATAWDRFRTITLPLLTPFTIIITLITVIEATNVFDLMLTLTGGGPFYATEVIDIFVYRQAFTSNVPRLGYSSAAAIFFGVSFVVLASIQILILRKVRSRRHVA